MKTKNYGIFRFKENNRPISDRHVKKLMKSIENNGYIEAMPIIVNSDMVIIDGQHRYQACKNMNIDIVYEICSGNENQLLLDLNVSQLKWQQANYIAHHAKNGIIFYQLVTEIEAMYHLSTSNTIVVCGGRNVNADMIKKGVDIPINTNMMKVINILNEAKKTLSFWKGIKFVRAITKTVDVLSDKQYHKLVKYINVITEQAQENYYVIQFENIINRHSREKIKLTSK